MNIPFPIKILITICLLPLCCACNKSESLQAEKGRLNLAHWDYTNTLFLDENWEFYPDTLLEPGVWSMPEKVPPVPRYFSFPSTWKKNNHIPPGYATYRLHLEGVRPGVPLALNCQFWGCAYKLWIGNKLYKEAGVIGREADEIHPASSLTNNLMFVPSAEELDIMLHVATREDRWSNHKRRFMLGSPEGIQKLNNSDLAIGLLLIGSIGIIGVYFLIFFMLRRQEKSSLYFGLFSLHLCFILFFDQFTISSHFLHASYYFIIRILNPITYSATICFLKYLKKLYPDTLRLRLYRFYQIMGIPYITVTLFIPMNWAFMFSDFFTIACFFPLLFEVAFKLFKITLSHRNLDTGFILAGTAVLVLTFSLDTYLKQLKDLSFVVTPLGFIIFVLFQAMLLSRRFVTAFQKVETLSEELEQKNKKLVAADKMKDEFLANTSHELRTPLHAIIGLSDSLIDGVTGELPPPAVKHLEMISSSGKRLYNLVNDILDFSKLKNKELVLHVRPTDIRPVIESVVFFSRQLIKEKQISIDSTLPADLPLVAADENRLEQILFNLIGNAIKFTDKGSINIKASCPGEMMAISVEDTGCGIPPEKQSSIFNAFEQGDGSVVRAAEGTGLGLAITKKLLELQKGHIEVVSEPGEGSCFTFYLPCSREKPDSLQEKTTEMHLAVDPPPAVREIRSLPETFPGTQENIFQILVIDDDPVNIQVVENQLFSNEYKILSTTNGQEALDYLQKQPDIDLVLLDVMMPGISGYQVCRCIRENFSLYELPVLMLTARNQVMDIVEGFDSGTNDYLVKPFNRQEIRSRVRTLLNLKHLTKTNNALESANKLKSRLMHMVAHDIKNPLASIKLNTTLINRRLETRSDTGKIDKYVLSIRKSSEKMNTLVTEFLENERIQEGKCILARTEFDVRELLEEIIDAFRDAATLKKQTLLPDKGGPVFLKADRLRLEEIIANLVSNAVKYSPPATKIFLRLFEGESDVTIEVEDQGPGFAAEDMPRLFEPFQRLSARPTGEESSTGLGLAITKGLVELHGGSIDILQRKGKGALFRVILPLQD